LLKKCNKILINENIKEDSIEYQEAMDILSFWRTNHLESLQYISDLLKDISLLAPKLNFGASKMKSI